MGLGTSAVQSQGMLLVRGLAVGGRALPIRRIGFSLAASFPFLSTPLSLLPSSLPFLIRVDPQ